MGEDLGTWQPVQGNMKIHMLHIVKYMQAHVFLIVSLLLWTPMGAVVDTSGLSQERPRL